MQLGQHPEASHVVAHLSDPHLLAGDARLYGEVDSTRRLAATLEQLERSAVRPDAIVFTGDLADLGEEAAYIRLRELVEPVAARLDARLVWVMGNHDEREPYARVLFDEPGGGVRAQDRVVEVRGLRIVSLDTSVPGYHHGALDPEQLAWLREALATRAEHGTLVALHHPPIPAPLTPAMAILELEDQDALAAAIEGSDVRGILGGHLHYSTHSTFAGVPVSVASASCYTLAVGRADTLLGGYDAFQAFDAVHVYPDRVVHTTVPLGEPQLVTGYPGAALERIAAIPADQRRAVFSRKSSGFSIAEMLGAGPDAAARAQAAVEAELAALAQREE